MSTAVAAETFGSCESTTAAVHPRDTGAISVGETGSGLRARATSTWSARAAPTTSPRPTPGRRSCSRSASGSSFDATATDAGGCVLAAGPPATATCPLTGTAAPNVPALDALLLAGMGGDDTITTAGFPPGATVVGLGGAGADTINGGPSEDVLVDGPPSDTSARHAPRRRRRRRAPPQRRRRLPRRRRRLRPLPLGLDLRRRDDRRRRAARATIATTPPGRRTARRGRRPARPRPGRRSRPERGAGLPARRRLRPPDRDRGPRGLRRQRRPLRRRRRKPAARPPRRRHLPGARRQRHDPRQRRHPPTGSSTAAKGEDSAVVDLAAVVDPAPIGCEQRPRRNAERIRNRDRTAAARAGDGPAADDPAASAAGHEAEAEARPHPAADEAAPPPGEGPAGPPAPHRRGRLPLRRERAVTLRVQARREAVSPLPARRCARSCDPAATPSGSSRSTPPATATRPRRWSRLRVEVAEAPGPVSAPP